MTPFTLVMAYYENAGMLLMLAVYAGATAFQLQMHTLIVGFGALVTLGMVPAQAGHAERS